MTSRKKKNTAKRKPFSSLGVDWVLVAVIIIFCIAGLAFLASALSIQSQEEYQQELLKQLVLGVGLGGLLAYWLSRFDYHKLLNFSGLLVFINFLLLGFIALFALYVNVASFGQNIPDTNKIRLDTVRSVSFLPIRPHAANGAIRWIDLPALPNFQPSEFTKIALLIYLAYYLQKREDKKDSWILIKRPLYAFLISAGLIFLQPDLGTVILIFCILLSAMWTAKVPAKTIIWIGGMMLAVFLGITLTTGFRIGRINAWLAGIRGDTVAEVNANSTQVSNVLKAIESGGLWGKGYGAGETKLTGAIPEIQTDAILALIGEEMGFILTTLFLSLYLIFLWRGLNIAARAPDISGKSLATGISVWITTQACFNIMGFTGLMPLTGIPLPFVSQGGSAMVINLIATGILLNISSQRVKVKVD